MDLDCRTVDSAVCLPRPKGGRGAVAACRGTGEATESLCGVKLGILNFDTSSSLSCLPLLRVSL
jgi:hypothetical protein